MTEAEKIIMESLMKVIKQLQPEDRKALLMYGQGLIDGRKQ